MDWHWPLASTAPLGHHYTPYGTCRSCCRAARGSAACATALVRDQVVRYEKGVEREGANVLRMYLYFDDKGNWPHPTQGQIEALFLVF